MILTSLQALTVITVNNLPSNIFLTLFNNIIMNVNMIRNGLSQPINPNVSISGNTITIDSHQRIYMDGKITTMPSGSITTTLPSSFWLIYNNTSYKITTEQPVQGNVLVVGYWNGSMFTSYRIGNV